MRESNLGEQILEAEIPIQIGFSVGHDVGTHNNTQPRRFKNVNSVFVSRLTLIIPLFRQRQMYKRGLHALTVSTVAAILTSVFWHVAHESFNTWLTRTDQSEPDIDAESSHLRQVKQVDKIIHRDQREGEWHHLLGRTGAHFIPPETTCGEARCAWRALVGTFKTEKLCFWRRLVLQLKLSRQVNVLSSFYIEQRVQKLLVVLYF